MNTQAIYFISDFITDDFAFRIGRAKDLKLDILLLAILCNFNFCLKVLVFNDLC